MIVTRSKDSKVIAWWNRMKARVGLGKKPAMSGALSEPAE